MTPKIALCFLTYENLSQPKLWNTIIQNNKDKINVYIHNKTDFKNDEFNFQQYCIKNKINDTRWGHISLVKATLQLFKEAFLYEENEYFILLSDKCIPLYKFDYIYNSIFHNNANQIQLVLNQNKERHDNFLDHTIISKEEFVKQHQWLLLNRETVDFFIKNDFTNLFPDNFYVPDEHYFINFCHKYHIPYINERITFTNWSEGSDNTIDNCVPKTYEVLSNEMIKGIKEHHPKCYFMRKIRDTCVLPSYFDTIV
jgi:hypothetical protein